MSFEKKIERARLRESMSRKMGSPPWEPALSDTVQASIEFDRFGFAPELEAIYEYLATSCVGDFRIEYTHYGKHPRDCETTGRLTVSLATDDDAVLWKLKV